jgi:hypothetical protein
MTRRLPRLDIRQTGRKVWIALGVLAAVNVVFFVAIVQPAVREQAQLSEQREPFQKFNRHKVVVERHEGFLDAVRQADLDLNGLREEILSTRNERMVQVQQELARLCEQFNIDLNMVNVCSEDLLGEELDRFSMTVPLEGGYPNLRKFLQAVEQSEQFFVVERVSLARGKAGGKLLSLNIILATYFTAPEELVRRSRALGRRR